MTNLSGSCPICDASIQLGADTKASEIITCSDCGTKLVVDAISGTSVSLSQAPEVEEDWGQ